MAERTWDSPSCILPQSIAVTTERSWDSFLPELLELILSRLPVADYLRFSAVCQSWRRVQRDHRFSPALSALPNPWLFLPDEKPYLLYDDMDEETTERRFYNITEKRYYRLPLPLASEEKFFLGTSHGWLLFQNYRNKLIVILNPFTGNEIHIPVSETIMYVHVYIGILSSSPTDPGCILVLKGAGDISSHFYCLISDKEWKIWTMEDDLLDDVEFFNGQMALCGGKLYLEGGSKLMVVELLSVPVERCLDMVGLPPLMPNTRRFLVVSDGEILLASANYELTETYQVRWESFVFDVFKADTEKKIWVRLESLGDRNMFLGHEHRRPNYTLCLPTLNTGGPGNRIYYTRRRHSFMDGSKSGPMWIEYDYGTHKVVSGDLQNLSMERIIDDYLCWVVPSLC